MDSSNPIPSNPQGHFQKNLNELGDDCQKRLDTVSKDLTTSNTQLSQLLKAPPVDHLKPVIETLNKSKLEALIVVNKYFASLEKELREMDADKLPKQDVDRRAQKLLSRIAERQQVLTDLSRDLAVKGKMLDAMKVIGDPKFETENQAIQKEIDECQNLLKGDSVQLVKDPEALPGLTKVLEQFIRANNPNNPLNLQSNVLAANRPQEEQQKQQQEQQAPPEQPAGKKVEQGSPDKFRQKDLEDEWERNTRRQEKRRGSNSPSPTSGIPFEQSSIKIEKSGRSPTRGSPWKTSPKMETPALSGIPRFGADKQRDPSPPSNDNQSNPQSAYGRYGSPKLENSARNPFPNQNISPTKNASPTKQLAGVTDTTFESGVNVPTVHFFQDNSKKLHLIDLKTAEKTGMYVFEEVNLNINFKIPVWHRSTVTRQGTIYLTGGSDPESKEQRNFSDVYAYDPIEKTLKPKSKMNFARNSHGICVLKNYIYVVGGCLKEGGYTTSCERSEVGQYYEKSHSTWEKIAPLKKAAYAPCVTSFNDTCLYKFGGYLNLSTMNNSIERYDPREDRWTEINYRVFGGGSNFGLMAQASCVQVNEGEILVFGGENLERKCNQIYSYKPGYSEDVIHKKEQTLPERGTFWNNAVTFRGMIVALQNVQVPNSDAYFLSERRIIVSDGKFWEQLNQREF